MKYLRKAKLPLSLGKENHVRILLIVTYNAHSLWRQKFAFRVCQQGMGRRILGVKLIDRVRYSILPSKTQIVDFVQKAASLNGTGPYTSGVRQASFWQTPPMSGSDLTKAREV